MKTELLFKGRALRDRLNNIYALLDCCLKYISHEDSFDRMCQAVYSELDHLGDSLLKLEEKYAQELPVSGDEPLEVEWEAEFERLAGCSEELRSSEFYRDMPNFSGILAEKLFEVAEQMNRIAEKLIPEDNAEIYISYSVREMQHYHMNGWMGELRKIRGGSNVHGDSTNRGELYMKQRNHYLKRVADLTDGVVDMDSGTIYQEPLGRHLWGFKHNMEGTPQQHLDILKSVKAAQHFGVQAHQEIVFLPKKVVALSEEEEAALNEEERMQLELQRKQELVETLRQRRLPNVVFLVFKCQKHFVKGVTQKWLSELLEAMILDAEISEQFCTKLADQSKNKTVCQLLGELKKLNLMDDNVNGAQLAKELNLYGIAADSVKRYIREGFRGEEESLHNFMADYLTREKEEETASEEDDLKEA